MPKVRMQDGSVIDVPFENLFNDDGTTPLPPPPDGPVFTQADIERVRSEEKDKLYGKIETLQGTITELTNKVGTLTDAEQQRLEAAQAEQRRLEEEARREGLDGKTIQAIESTTQTFQQRLDAMEQEWQTKLEEERQARESAEALRLKEQEFNDVREYARAQYEANKDDIAPQLAAWIGGNSREEVDASIARAKETTAAIVTDLSQTQQQVQQVDPATGQPIVQQPVPPVLPALPGTRPTAGPAGQDPAQQYQQLTKEQIANMPMEQYAQLRGRLGIGGQGNNKGLFG